VVSFGSRLNANLWDTWNGWAWDQLYFDADRTSVVSSQLKLSIMPCNESDCSAFDFSSGGVVTKLHTYGYGIYTAQIKAPANSGFSAIMEVRTRTILIVPVLITHSHSATLKHTLLRARHIAQQRDFAKGLS
jgi:hypothetical protein